MRQRLLYGWHDERGYLISRYPPDSPVRPAVCLETLADANEMAKRQRSEILWYPPLADNAA